MLDILKRFSGVGKKTITESTVTECGDMGSYNTPVSVNLSAGSADEMAMILRALSGINSSTSIEPMPQDNMSTIKSIVSNSSMEDDAAYADTINDNRETEESFINEPDEEYQDHDYMVKALSGGINRQKRMYAKSQDGDNAMAVESIKDRLTKALAEAKAKPDYIDIDGDGDKKEPMKKAVADKKKAPVKESEDDLEYAKKYLKHLQRTDASSAKIEAQRKKIADMEKNKTNEAAKPDFLDMDKDGNKKEPMKKAIADKKKKTNEAEVQESPSISPTFIKHLQMTFGDKAQLSRSEMRKVEDMLDKLDIANIKTLMGANIPHVSQMAKLYLRNKTPGGMVKYKEAEVQTPTHELDDTARKATNIAQMIKRKINSGEKMDDMDYNQMAELGHVLSRFGTNFGPKTMKDVFNHMKQYTDDRNEYGTGYPEFTVDRFKELIAMARSAGEAVGETYKSKAVKMTESQFDEAAGEKDACYHKVKSRYKVWPSAYASGALAKCRKVGASNWGNKN